MGNALMTVCGAQSIINVCMRSIYHLPSISNKGFLNNSEFRMNLMTNITKCLHKSFLIFAGSLPSHFTLGASLVVGPDNGFYLFQVGGRKVAGNGIFHSSRGNGGNWYPRRLLAVKEGIITRIIKGAELLPLPALAGAVALRPVPRRRSHRPS
mgnify:CR=1 FL=1